MRAKKFLHATGNQLVIVIRSLQYHYLLGLIVAGLLCISTLLFMEYRFFKQQTEKMIEAQEDYRNYVIAVKKVLHEYRKNKSRLDDLEVLLSDREKKNDNNEEILSENQATFPEGVRVYSSDGDQEDETDSFLLINRELEYLKQSTFNYLKKQKVTYLENHINPDTWLEYTDQILERKKSEKQRRQRKAGRKRYVQPSRALDTLHAMRFKKLKHSDMALLWPIERSEFWLSSFFGPRRKPNGLWGFHAGIDMAAVRGTPVRAASSGVVVEARYSAGYGKTIVIAHTQKYRTRYAHLNSMAVSVGQKVERGQNIGKVGATGFVRSKRGGDASHLHFEVYVYGKQVNPMYFLG